MFIKLMLAILVFMTSNISYSQISQEEWVSLCQKAQGPKRHTCEIIRRKLGVFSTFFYGNWGVVYEKLLRVKDLNLSHCNISDLSPLAGFTHFEYLDLLDNKISNLSPLAGMVNLKSIWLGNNRVRNLSPLAGLRQLFFLWLANNRISNLTPLAGLTELQWLMVEGNPIEEFSPVDHVLFVLREPNRHPPRNFQLNSRLPKQEEIGNAEIFCAVCLNGYEEGHDLSEIPDCLHFFHKDCLQAWLEKHSNCPLCRATIPSD